MVSQEKLILEALKAGETLTPLDALTRFGCLALSQRCGRLRRQGHPIVARMIEINGKRVAEYRYQQEEV